MFEKAQQEYEDLNLEGFQVVRSEMFFHGHYIKDPVCTIWPSKISFSKSCIKVLNGCEYVRFEVNPVTKGLLLVPCSSKDENCIRWIKGGKDPCVRNLQSAEFGGSLYKSWKLDDAYNYRASGKLIAVKQKIMLYFDFTKAEKWIGKREG